MSYIMRVSCAILCRLQCCHSFLFRIEQALYRDHLNILLNMGLCAVRPAFAKCSAQSNIIKGVRPELLLCVTAFVKCNAQSNIIKAV